ncbi:MAG: hypothetical protein ACVCEJ_11150 [Candidatus Izemoplasmataceae bacterium]
MIFIPVGLIFIPILSGVIIYLFKHRYVNYLSIVAQLLVTILVIVYYVTFKESYSDTYIVFGLWDERIGISLYNDALSLSFVMLSVFIWWMVLLYTLQTKDSFVCKV